MKNENLTINKLEEQGFIGQDIGLDISLFEYGLAWKENDKEIEFIYAIGHNITRFDRVSIDKSIDVRKEYDWAEFNEVENFVGATSADWDKLELPQKIADLLSYYGFENVFGSSYWEGFEIKE